MRRPKIASKAWITSKELFRFLKVITWVTGTQNYVSSYKLLIVRITNLWSESGPQFTFMYLKEVLRLVIRSMAGFPESKSFNKILVKRDSRGLPTIIPLDLRLILAQKADWSQNRMVIVGLLSLLSVFRVFPTVVKPDFSSIEGEFSGLSRTMDSNILRSSLFDLFGKVKVRINSFNLVGGESAGPNSVKAAWGSGIDALAFIHHPKQLYHLTLWLYNHNGKWWIVWLYSLLFLGGPLYIVLRFFGCPKLNLGKLAVVYEQAGKARIVAVTNWWIQLAFKPLHDSLFSLLRKLETDGTFDQEAPLNRLIELNRLSIGEGLPKRVYHSFDLSAATDRLPIDLQVDLLKILLGSSAINWRGILDFGWAYQNGVKEYAVGQPMGAYSSWAMLAITHHVIVRMAAMKVGLKGFSDYAVLGDDVVICNDDVAAQYLILMETLGLNINLSKSVQSKDFAEFAKRWRGADIDFTPIGPGLVLRTLRNKFFVGRLIAEALKLNFVNLHSVLALLQSLDLMWKWDSQIVVSMWTCFGPGSWLTRSHIEVQRTIMWCAYGDQVDPEVFRYSLYNALLERHRARNVEASKKLELEELFFYRNWYKIFSSTKWPTRLLEAFLKVLSPGFWIYAFSYLTKREHLLEAHLKLLNFKSGSWEEIHELWTLMAEVDISSINWAEKDKISEAGKELVRLTNAIDRSYNESYEFISGQTLYTDLKFIKERTEEIRVHQRGLAPAPWTSLCALFLWFFFLYCLLG